MTTLEDLETIIPDVIKKLEDIASAMSRYKKIKTDGRARVLINEINGKIKQIQKVHVVYKTSPSFKNHNFDEYVKMIRNYIVEYQDLYERIMKFENVIDYH
ncbi:MAG: hypothetical protein IJX17_05795 [Clostridia bacterium]|nr:hypothetical protein [Clostridia bacterium]